MLVFSGKTVNRFYRKFVLRSYHFIRSRETSAKCRKSSEYYCTDIKCRMGGARRSFNRSPEYSIAQRWQVLQQIAAQSLASTMPRKTSAKLQTPELTWLARTKSPPLAKNLSRICSILFRPHPRVASSTMTVRNPSWIASSAVDPKEETEDSKRGSASSQALTQTAEPHSKLHPAEVF